MERYHRIQIGHAAYVALKAEAVTRDTEDIRDIASQILLAGVSKEALMYSGQSGIVTKKELEPSGTQDQDGPVTDSVLAPVAPQALPEPIAPGAPAPYIPLKRPKLSEDEAALATIRELWAAGEHNAAAIGKKIGYSRKTTWQNINKLGLKEDAKV